MTEEAKAEDLVGDLREAFASRIRESARDLPAHQALQLADTLCSVWLDRLAGMRVTHRAKPPVDAERIAEDWARGLSVEEIVSKHRCSRATAYRSHPSKRKQAANTR